MNEANGSFDFFIRTIMKARLAALIGSLLLFLPASASAVMSPAVSNRAAAQSETEQQTVDDVAVSDGPETSEDSVSPVLPADPDDDNQPEWFTTPRRDARDVYYESLHTEPMQSPGDASEAIPRVVLNRVRYHIETWTGEHNDPDIVRNLGFDREYLMENVVTPNRKEVRGSHHAHFDDDDIDFVGGPDINFFCGYVEIQLTPEFKELVDERFVEYLTRRRLYTVGAVSVGLIGLMAISFVYLRLDHATRGFYSRRLMLGAAVVAILVILFCISLLNHV